VAILKASISRPVKSATRVARILELVASATEGVQLADVARGLGIPRSSAHALLVDLTHSRLLDVQPGSNPPRYQVGLLAFEVGSAFLRQRNLADEARLIVDRLAAETDENAHLAIRDGRDIMYIAKAESTNAMRVASYVGLRIPAHATAVGKVLLSQLETTQVLELFRSTPPRALTNRTKTRLDEIIAELQTVRENGYAFDDEESTVGLQCVGVPVFDASGACVAGLSVSIPTIRMAERDQSALVSLVRDHADALSHRLGAAHIRRAVVA
jgi:IclR family KDG regulon transcriptional repressor